MSVQAITAALAVQGVTPSEKLLLIVLANYADEHSTCWPSQSRLARDTCMSKRTIIRLFAALEARSLLSRRARHRQSVRITDLITLSLGGGDIMSPRGDNGDRKVVTERHQGGDTVAHRTVSEPKRKPSARPRARLAEKPARAHADRHKVADEWRKLAQKLGDPTRESLGLSPESSAAPDPAEPEQAVGPPARLKLLSTP